MTSNHPRIEPAGEHTFLIRLDLADVAAAYDDWTDHIRSRLRNAGEPTTTRHEAHP